MMASDTFYKSIIIIMTGMLLVSCVGLGYSIANDVKDDGKPDWADDMASKLSEKGGRVFLYRHNGSTAMTYDVFITAGQNVYADSYGLVIRSSNGVTTYQYDMIANIYINS